MAIGNLGPTSEILRAAAALQPLEETVGDVETDAATPVGAEPADAGSGLSQDAVAGPNINSGAHLFDNAPTLRRFLYPEGRSHLNVPALRVKEKRIEIPAAHTYIVDGVSGRIDGKNFSAMSYSDLPEGYRHVVFSLLDQDALAVRCNDDGEAVSFAVGDGVSGANFFSGVFTKMAARALSHALASASRLDDAQVEQEFKRSLLAELDEWTRLKEPVVKAHILEALRTVPSDGRAFYLRQAVVDVRNWSTMVVGGHIDRANGIFRFAIFGDVTVAIIDKDSGKITNVIQGSVDNQMVFDPKILQLFLPEIFFKTLNLPRNYRIVAFTDGMTKGKLRGMLEGFYKNEGDPKAVMDEIEGVLDKTVLDDDTTLLLADGRV